RRLLQPASGAGLDRKSRQTRKVAADRHLSEIATRLCFRQIAFTRPRPKADISDESHCGATRTYPRFSILSNVRIPLISVLVGIQTQSALAGLTSRTRNESDSASYAPSGEICAPPRSPTASRRNAIIT